LLLAATATALSLAGCGGNGDSSAGDTTAQPPPATTTPAVTATEPGTTETTETTSPAPEPVTIRIRVVGGTPVGGVARPKVAQGKRVVIVVRSDTADEIHLHGYDISRDVAAGGTARLPFVATLQGRFELELEHSGVQLAELTVR